VVRLLEELEAAWRLSGIVGCVDLNECRVRGETMFEYVVTGLVTVCGLLMARL
jgi:hypothetical protein